MSLLLGIEFGQRRSPSAICVAESQLRALNGSSEYHFLIRSLERLPVRTTFPALADRVEASVNSIRQRTDVLPVIYVNVTGTGDPLVKLLTSRVPTRIRPVTFNHGDRRTEIWPDVTLGKCYLVSRLQLLLQTSRIHLPRTHEAEILAKELLDYEIRVESDANERYGAFSVGTQDDLVTALGLAVQTDQPNSGVESGAAPLVF